MKRSFLKHLNILPVNIVFDTLAFASTQGIILQYLEKIAGRKDNEVLSKVQNVHLK